MESPAVTSPTDLASDLGPMDLRTTVGQANLITASLGTQEEFLWNVREEQKCEQLNIIDHGVQWTFLSVEERETSFMWHKQGFTGAYGASSEASSPSTDSMSAVSWSIDEDIRSLVATDYSCTQKTKIPGKQRAKVIFSDSQKEALESRFEKQKYLKPCEIASVAAEIGLTYKQVRTWFQNQRGRLKKQNAKREWEAQRFAHCPIYTPPMLPSQFDGGYSFNFTGSPEQYPYPAYQSVASAPTDAAHEHMLFPRMS